MRGVMGSHARTPFFHGHGYDTAPRQHEHEGGVAMQSWAGILNFGLCTWLKQVKVTLSVCYSAPKANRVGTRQVQE